METSSKENVPDTIIKNCKESDNLNEELKEFFENKQKLFCVLLNIHFLSEANLLSIITNVVKKNKRIILVSPYLDSKMIQFTVPLGLSGVSFTVYPTIIK